MANQHYFWYFLDKICILLLIYAFKNNINVVCQMLLYVWVLFNFLFQSTSMLYYPYLWKGWITLSLSFSKLKVFLDFKVIWNWILLNTTIAFSSKYGKYFLAVHTTGINEHVINAFIIFECHVLYWNIKIMRNGNIKKSIKFTVIKVNRILIEKILVWNRAIR